MNIWKIIILLIAAIIAWSYMRWWAVIIGASIAVAFALLYAAETSKRRREEW